MRLIEAEELINILEWNKGQDRDALVSIDSLIKLVRARPTAYSVDKVVGELECDRCESCSLLEVCAGSKYCGKCHERIIEIVKQGGVSDDVCEWKSTSDREFIQNPHTKRLYSNEASMKNVYCNTCGKKIKVVE